MSRLFVKRLYLTPLLAAKQSPRCRFPTRSFNSAANVYNSTAPGTAQGNEVSSNANLRRLKSPQNEDHLISRVCKLEDHAHSSDDRFINLMKESAASRVEFTKTIGDIGSKMEATIAAIHVEQKTEMAALRVEQKTEMAALRVEQKTDMSMLFTAMGKMHGELKANHWELKSEIVEIKSEIAEIKSELKSEIVDVKSELKSEIVEIKSKMGKISTEVAKTEDGIKSLSWQVKAIYGAALAVVGYFATKYPDEFLSFAKSMLARMPPSQGNRL